MNILTFAFMLLFNYLDTLPKLYHSLNRFTIFTQPSYSFAACLASGIGCVCSFNHPGQPTVTD